MHRIDSWAIVYTDLVLESKSRHAIGTTGRKRTITVYPCEGIMLANSHEVARPDAFEDHSAPASWLRGKADAYALCNTLDSYEVEEIDGHNLARLVPTIVIGNGAQEELAPEIPSRN
jgi:hypothetical protein